MSAPMILKTWVFTWSLKLPSSSTKNSTSNLNTNILFSTSYKNNPVSRKQRFFVLLRDLGQSKNLWVSISSSITHLFCVQSKRSLLNYVYSAPRNRLIVRKLLCLQYELILRCFRFPSDDIYDILETIVWHLGKRLTVIVLNNKCIIIFFIW